MTNKSNYYNKWIKERQRYEKRVIKRLNGRPLNECRDILQEEFDLFCERVDWEDEDNNNASAPKTNS